ncbi:MAG: DotI/IcmL/TraM family protein [Gammaproteobacteria bacterium]|nr:DotI/IcmL/TraM family protein [Gammaproteobacteria bacterium]
MADEEIEVVEIRDEFYRDSFGKVLLIILSMIIALGLLIGISLYLYLNQPPPKTFMVEKEWRVQPAVPLSQPYLTTPDLLQWVSDVLPKSFMFDFMNYNDQLKDITSYFTAEGWKVFQNQLNIYANYNKVQSYKIFVSAVPAGAPFLFNQGLVSETGIYGWWVQMPLTINYAGYSGTNSQTLTLQVLVVRVSTLNNLTGVAISNVLVVKSAGSQLGSNG